MKCYLLSAWTLSVLASSLFAAPASLAQSAAPSKLTATGLAGPIGANVKLYWGSVPAASAYRLYRDGVFLTSGPVARFVDYDVSPGETHVYSITSTVAGKESPRSAPKKAHVPAGAGQVIYADALENAWSCWGWAKMDFANHAPARSGFSVCVQPGPWQTMYLHHAPMNVSAYTVLTFWVNGGAAGGQKLMLRGLRSGTPQTTVRLDALPKNAWRQITVPLAALGLAGATDVDGLWLQDATGTTQSKFYVDEIALGSSATIVPAAPTPPTGLTVTPKWTESCTATCGTAMPHLDLAWQPVSGASFYTVYRDGAPVQAGITGTAWSDMDVVSGHTYSYAVSATGPGGESPRSASVSATAPQPVSGTLLTPPANVYVAGLWVGAAANVLSWQAVPGASAYSVYVSDVRVATGVTGTTFTITPDMLWGGAIFTVTSMDSKGMESIPSAPVGRLTAFDPLQPAVWWASKPTLTDALSVTPEWNQGSPRNRLVWHGRSKDSVYNVYRDGIKVAAGLWHPYYLDTNVVPGDTHSYAVTGVNTDWPIPVEGEMSAAVSGTALDSPPTPSDGKIEITKVLPNDDSAVVSFTPVPGATDYRVYDVHNPGKVKYAGRITYQVRATPAPQRMALSIEWNGIDPAKGADLVVEAVDKFGPFQRMDGATGSGVMKMSSLCGEAINGQGDPSNVPNVLAKSDSFHVDCVPVPLAGDQVFFDNFRNSQPFVLQPMPKVIPKGSQYYGSQNNYAAYDNDKWEVREYGADLTHSQFFAMGNHFMDTTYDGGGPHSPSPPHNNVASMVMMPRAIADISGGKVLHVTFEVDAHFNSRRWVEVCVGEAGDELINIAKFENHNSNPTVSGKFLRWQIEKENNTLSLFPAIDGVFSNVNLLQFSNFGDSTMTSRVKWDHVGPYANGTPQDLDKRHRFDLYLSKTHYRLEETTPDGMYNVVRERDFPEGTSLPFDKCQVYFVHQFYHSANDFNELTEYSPSEAYWYTMRPFCDERHWDNMGFSVLDAFPAP